MILKRLAEKIQYPKIFLLILIIAISYILFRADFFTVFAKILNSHGYISIFIAGLLFSYGFTAPLAVGFFVSLASSVNIFLAALIAGIGAVISDIIIFQFIRSSFQDEFDKLKLHWFFRKIHKVINNHLGQRIKKYALWVIAGFLIASPLPDEFGVSLISGFTDMNKKVFGVISYCLNTAGILVILWLAA